METIFRDLNRWLEKSCPGVADALRQTELRSILIGVSGAVASEIRLLMLVLLIVVGCDGHTLKGDGYKVELPESADDIDCRLVAEEEMAQLQTDAYQFISNPIMLTQKGNQHVQLDRMAKVSFDIPRDVPKEEYINLVGVLVTDDGLVYMIPEIEGIRRGVVSFETSHFCVAGAAMMEQEKRRNSSLTESA